MITIRPLEAADWPDVEKIYLEGIATGYATFQTVAPSWDEWYSSHLANLSFVAINDAGKLSGWTALTAVSGRCVYAGVAEVSIYIGEQFRGQQIGIQLLTHLINESEQNNIWTLQAGIFKQNTGSLKLHEKAGFRIIGFREKIGKLNGVWQDNLILERRSKITGI